MVGRFGAHVDEGRRVLEDEATFDCLGDLFASA
jgi:hypothetical protein